MRVAILCLILSMGIGVSTPVGSADDEREANLLEADELVYPKSERLMTGRGENAYQIIMATTDHFERVLEFYEGVTKADLQVTSLHERSDGGTVVTVNDSKGPYEKAKKPRLDRPVALQVFVRDTTDGYLTLVISRAETEAHTHIVVTRIAKSGP